MKLRSIILFTFISQISFCYDEVQDAVSSVPGIFFKLLDVATDVRDSMDCTLLTMGHMLDYDESLTYRKLCMEETPSDPSYYPQPQIDYNPLPSDVVISNEIMQEKQLTEAVLDTNINDAKMDINDTIFNFINRHSNMGYYQEEIIIVPQTINNDNVQNIDSISENIQKELDKIEQTQNNDTMRMLLKKLQSLQNEVKNNTNAMNKVHNIIMDILQELNNTQTLNNSTETNKFKELVLHIEKKSNKTYEDIEKLFKEWQILEIKRFDEIKALSRKQINSSQKITGTINSVSNQQDKPGDNIITTTIMATDIIKNMTQKVTVTTNTPKESTHNYPTSIFTIRTTLMPTISTTTFDASSNADYLVSSSRFTSVTTEATVTLSTMLTTSATKNDEISTKMPQKVTKLRDKITTERTTNTLALLTTKGATITTESSGTTIDIDDYNEFFNSNDGDDNKDAVQSALKVIQESKKSQSIFDKLFNIF
ncbi:hypothetical protein K1T71_005524 [Dendrolimus kikuchii]|uniref:Uncharacterized protein n=1 Tax=Dendrolimus kikuchii TaxID=765133 RepID=A0ACC1D4U6_9NEOP|nr:hypothetical protein K1T71_005524 [Dendrolimus kikuchii]